MTAAVDSGFSFHRAWALIKPHADPLLSPVHGALDAFGIPLFPLIQKTTTLVTPHFKLTAWLALLASANPHIMIFSAALWFTGEAACRHKLQRVPFTLMKLPDERTNIEQAKGATKLEEFSAYFNSEKIDLQTELEQNRATIAELQVKQEKNAELISQAEETKNKVEGEDRRTSLGGIHTLLRQIKLFINQDSPSTNEELESLTTSLRDEIGPKITRDIATLTERNQIISDRLADIERKKISCSSTRESQTLLFLITFIGIKLLPTLFMYPALIGMGVLLGNHLYAWVKRPPENQVGGDYIVVIATPVR